MNKKIRMVCFFVVVTVFVLPAAFGSTQLETASIKEAEKVIRQEAKEHGVKNVLVVFDIDHTLLTPYGDLGSSYWFKWQVAFLSTPKRENEQIAADYDQLGKITRRVLEAVEMRTVEGVTRSVVTNTMSQGLPTLILTARSPDLRKATNKEFKANALPYPSPVIGKDISRWMVGKGHYMGDLTEAEVKNFGLLNPHPVGYEDGIFMVNEQHKGAMLRAFLTHFGISDKFKAIVLIDDSRTNCKNVQQAFKNKKSIDVTTVLYTAEHPRVERFRKGSKWAAAAAYQRLQAKLNFGEKKR